MGQIQKIERTLKQHLFGGFVWGVFMFIIIEIVFKLMENEAITTKSILFGLVWWIVIAGGTFGVANYYIAQYLKKRAEKKGINPNN